MNVSAVLGQAFGGYRALWACLGPLSLIVQLVLWAFGLALVFALGLTGVVAFLALLVVGYFWTLGVLVKAIDDIQHHPEADVWIGTRLARVWPRINALSLAAILGGIGITAGLFALVVPGLILMVWWSLFVPAIVLENRGPIDALKRSRQLVRGHGWPVFCVLVVTGLLTGGLERLIGQLFVSLPIGEAAAAILPGFVSACLVTPFAALAVAVLYYELRDGTPASAQLAVSRP